MLEQDLIDLLMEICELYEYKPHTKNISNPIPIREIVEAAVSGSIIQHLVHKYSKQKISTALKYTFPDRDSTKSTSLVKFLLAKAELAYCHNCNTVKTLEEFYHYSRGEYFSQCKECSKNSRRVSYYKDPQKELVANTVRKLRKNTEQTPYWADLKKIEEFYKNRPEGCHVDHIVPLNGANVCGLHVLENLQYLTVEENLKKSNFHVP